MKIKLLGLMLLAGGSMFAQTRFSIGVGIGGPAYPAARVAVGINRPPCPGPGYSWVDPYYDSYGSLINGYWAAPTTYFGGSYGAYYTAPRYYGGYHRGFDRDDRRFDHRRDFDRGHDSGGRQDSGRGRDLNHNGGRSNGHGRR